MISATVYAYMATVRISLPIKVINARRARNRRSVGNGSEGFWRNPLAARSSSAVAFAFNLDENRAERRRFPAERFPTDGSKILESETTSLWDSREESFVFNEDVPPKLVSRNAPFLSLSNNSSSFNFRYSS